MIAAKTEKITLPYFFIPRFNLVTKLELREQNAGFEFTAFGVPGVFGVEQTEQSGETSRR
jgi:hypothetical protein